MTDQRKVPCEECEDGLVYKSRYGGNDPDTWTVKCDECDGTGWVWVDQEEEDEDE